MSRPLYFTSTPLDGSSNPIVKQIAADPFARHPQIKRLKRGRNTFRYRLGDWRNLYRIDRKTRTLEVLDIRPRGGAYQ